MANYVDFQVYIRGYRAKRVPLVYEGVGTSLPTYPDTTNDDGFVRTTWTDAWIGKSVKVYCHTDGVNSGTPKFAKTITIKNGLKVELSL